MTFVLLTFCSVTSAEPLFAIIDIFIRAKYDVLSVCCCCCSVVISWGVVFPVFPSCVFVAFLDAHFAQRIENSTTTTTITFRFHCQNTVRVIWVWCVCVSECLNINYESWMNGKIFLLLQKKIALNTVFCIVKKPSSLYADYCVQFEKNRTEILFYKKKLIFYKKKTKLNNVC